MRTKLTLAVMPFLLMISTASSEARLAPGSKGKLLSVKSKSPVSRKGKERLLRLVDMVVAVVNRSVITLSEVELEARHYLIRLKRYQTWNNPIANAIKRSALEYLILERMIYDEAKRLAYRNVPRKLIERAMKRFKSAFPSPRHYQIFLRQAEMSPREIADTEKRRLLINRFIANTVNLLVQVDSRKVESYYLKNKHLFVGMPRKKALRLIRRSIRQREYKQQYRQWLKKLRRRSKIKILFSFK